MARALQYFSKKNEYPIVKSNICPKISKWYLEKKGKMLYTVLERIFLKKSMEKGRMFFAAYVERRKDLYQ
jgi:hypothetical protein